jgi:RNA polymerase sigma factor (sigma-70 family)
MGKRKNGRHVSSERFGGFFNKNKGLIKHVVYQEIAKDERLDPDELFSEGLIAMHRGLELYDPNKGCKETTYCMDWIRSKIARCAQNIRKRWSKESDILDSPLERSGDTFVSHLKDNKADDPVDLSDKLAIIAELKKAIASKLLNPTEKQVIRFFFKGFNFREISELMDITRHGAYLSYRSAIEKIRREIRFRRLKDEFRKKAV